jgi:regulator of sigma E protease
MLTIVSLIFVLGVLIFVHELGHFMAAKSVGIGVPRFSIGLGPITPLRFQRGETEYVISWIPFGGYVKMATNEEEGGVDNVEGGEVEQEFPEDKLFESKSVAARIFVISAGVIMNALFAWAVYGFMAFSYGDRVDPTTAVAEIRAEGLPAVALPLTDVPFGSRILSINGEEVNSRNDIRNLILAGMSETLVFEFSGDAGRIEVPISVFEADERVAVLTALVPLHPPTVGVVTPGTPASDAGLRAMDEVLFIDGDTVRSARAMVGLVENRAGDELEFMVSREGEILSFAITPDPVEVPADGGTLEVGRIGIGFWLDSRRVTYGPLGSVAVGFRAMVDNAGIVLFSLKGLLSGAVSPKELGGPILIGQIAGQAAALGFEPLLLFMAFLSMNLAVLNLLPIPVLDGGHLVFLILEAVRRKPLSVNVRMRMSQVGLVLLLALMAMAFTNDIVRLFS